MKKKERLDQIAAQAEEQEVQLDSINHKLGKKEQRLAKVQEQLKAKKELAVTFTEIDGIGRKTLFSRGKIEMTEEECDRLKRLAKHGLLVDGEVSSLKEELAVAKREASTWKQRYDQLKEQVKGYLEAMRKAPQRVKEFISTMLSDTVPAERGAVARNTREPSVYSQRGNHDQLAM